MGWAWYVNDLSKYLPDAETLAEMAPTDDDVVGVEHDVPLSEIALEPEIDVPAEIDTQPHYLFLMLHLGLLNMRHLPVWHQTCFLVPKMWIW